MNRNPKKINRNDPCHCKSGKKYKFCCEKEDAQRRLEDLEDFYHSSQSEAGSEDLGKLTEVLTEYGEVINISNRLRLDNYKTFQVKNFKTGTIMVAEKTKENAAVFEERDEGEGDDTLVMFKGSYRIFKSSQMAQVIDSVLEMILARSLNMDDKVAHLK
jgi:SEC-C motif